MDGRTLTRADLSEAVFQEVGLSRNESGDWSRRFWTKSARLCLVAKR